MTKKKTVKPKIEAVTPEEVKPREFKLPKREKLCIVGCADSKAFVPFDRKDEFEFWGVNNLYLTLPGPYTRWFDLHTFGYDPVRRIWLRRGQVDFRGQPVNKYIEQLNELNMPVYVQKPFPALPNGVIYPISEVLQKFGDYFTNTISYMLALGIMEGFKEIHIYGVDMAVDTEYFWQRPSCEYMIGFARGQGIGVYLPDECDLLKTRFLYGFHEIMELKFTKKLKAMKQAMIQRREKAMAKATMHQKQLEQYNGALSAAQEMDKIWSGSVDLWPEKKKAGGI